MKSELQRVHKGKKALSVFSFPYSSIRSDSHRELIECAFSMNLACVEKHEKIDINGSVFEQTRVFVTKLNEIWRINAYMLTRSILSKFDWSDGMEYFESILLGYNESECNVWIDKMRLERVGWLGKTVYAVLCSNSIERIKLLGMKSFDPYEPKRDITIYFSRDRSIVRPESLNALEADNFICRFSIESEYFDAIFGKSKLWDDRNIIKSIVEFNEISMMNKYLNSKIYILNKDGWQ